MSRTAFSTVGTFTPDKLIAGNTHPIDTKAVALATGTETLLRGTLINSSGAKCNATYADGTEGTFVITIGTAFVNDEVVTIAGTEYTCKTSPTAGSDFEFAVGASSTTQATALKDLLTLNNAITDTFSLATSTNTITLTQKIAGVGTKPTLVEEAATGAAAIAAGTAGARGTKAIDTPVGILCDSTLLDASSTTESLMFICGDFKASEITVGADVTIADFELELQKLGIFLK